MGAPGYERVAEKPLRKASGRVPSRIRRSASPFSAGFGPAGSDYVGVFPAAGAE